MNRSGVNLGRLISTCSLKKVNSISSPVSQFKSYHMTSNRQELLKFTPTSIYTEQTRRTLFSSKESEPAKDAKKEEGEAAEEVSEAEKALQEQVATLAEKNEDLLDKYRRSLADFENLRNRMNKQVADAKIFGIQGFCKVFLDQPLSVLDSHTVLYIFQDLLDVADVLNKAISSVPKEELGQSQSLTDLHQGLQLTESQLLKVC